MFAIEKMEELSSYVCTGSKNPLHIKLRTGHLLNHRSVPDVMLPNHAQCCSVHHVHSESKYI